MAESDGAASQLDYEGYVRLIQQVDELVAAFDSHPDEAIRERVLALLTAVDLLHRTALERLVEGVHDQGGAPLLERLSRDRVVETLLGLYGLAELQVPEEEEVPAEDGMPAGTVGFVPRASLALGRSGGGSG